MFINICLHYLLLLITSPKLLTGYSFQTFPSLETAQLFTNHVFWLYGIPLDIVSDRQTQFTSQVLQILLCTAPIGVSLSSGFHPQTGGTGGPCVLHCFN